MTRGTRLFLDTASLADIQPWARLGLVDGVTTTPALLAREGGAPLVKLRKIAAVVSGPVSAQVTAERASDMIVQGRALAALSGNVIVKLPASLEGLRAARDLTDEGIDCNVTLAFEPAQGLAFARVPVAYLSLILGRVEDFGPGALERVHETRQMLDALGSPTRLLVASLRNPNHLRTAVTHGANVVTVPPSTWESVYANPLTQQGQTDFLAAWQRLDPELRRDYDELGHEKAEAPIGQVGC